MIEFKNKDYPNLHLTIQGVEIKVTVTLNVSKDMLQYLPEKTFCYSNKRYVHFMSYSMNLIHANEKMILNTANGLIGRLMVNARIAKKRILEDKITEMTGENYKEEPKQIFASNNDMSYGKE